MSSASQLPSDGSDLGSSSSSSSSSPRNGGTATAKAMMLGKFRLISVLGKGGMGKVVRAEDTSLKRQVALKCLKSKPGPQTYRIEQFIREARSAATLEHPSIVQVYEVGDAGGYHYIAMELIEGGTLHALVKACGPLDMHRACQLTAEAAEALAHAAQLGVIHRDIKPQNLMLTRSGRCKITDFGLARIDDPADGFAMPSGAVGTPTYMAPEVIGRQPATAKSDVYSLAAVLFFLLTGRPPFQAKERSELLRMHLQVPAPDILTLRPDLPDSLARILARALAKNPDERPTPDTFSKQLRAHTIPVGSNSFSAVPAGQSSPFIPPMPAAQPAAPVAAAPLPGAYSLTQKPRFFWYGVLAGGAIAVIAVVATAVVVLLNRSAPARVAPSAPRPAPVAMPQPAPGPELFPTPSPAEPAQPAEPARPPAPVAAAPMTAAPAGASETHELQASDRDAIRAEARALHKVTIVGKVASLNLTGKFATLTLEGNPDLQITYYFRLYSAMARKFGGHDGDAINGKAIRVTGSLSLFDNKPELIINSPAQIEQTR